MLYSAVGSETANLEPYAVLRSFGHPDRPVVSVHYLLDNAKAKPSPVLGCGVARLEHIFPFVFRDTRSVIFQIKPSSKTSSVTVTVSPS